MLSKSPLYFVIGLFLATVVILLTDSNHSLFLAINKVGTQFADEIWLSVAIFGNKALTLSLLLLALWHKPHLLRAALIAGLFVMIISLSIVPLIALARPPALLSPDSFHLIGEKLTTNSFPATQVIAIFAILGSIAFYFKNGLLTFCVLSFSALVALSYIMLGIHWPSDILIGAALGWLCAWLGVYLIRANILRKNDIWNYLTYIIYLLIAAYLFWTNTVNNNPSFIILVVSIFAVLVALWSIIWVKKGGTKDPVSVVGWLS